MPSFMNVRKLIENLLQLRGTKALVLSVRNLGEREQFFLRKSQETSVRIERWSYTLTDWSALCEGYSLLCKWFLHCFRVYIPQYACTCL